GDRALTAAGPAPRVIEQCPVHGPIQGAKKILPIRPGDLLPVLVSQALPPEGRDHQRRSLEGALAFVAEEAPGPGFDGIEEQDDIVPPEGLVHRALLLPR